jgi:UDP:flavonoid glycosyltransferase YjiC (YdhE family)
MKKEKVLLISPPFSSQLSPTLALAGAFRAGGMQTSVACGEAFSERIHKRGFGFVPLLVNRNANTGVAQQTSQPEEEQRRLRSFLESTKKGAVQTLLQQSRDRREDMFADPEPLFEDIERINAAEKPDLWIANQLSYAVTLVLYCLGYPFASFCPPHPLTIPRGDKTYGVPAAWPSCMRVNRGDLDALNRIAREVEHSFTDEFNRIIALHGKPGIEVSNAFRLTSKKAVFYNYPDFEGNTAPGHSQGAFYLGSCFEEEPLPPAYSERLEQSHHNSPKILIVLGTFLSYRQDVLEACITGAKKRFPGSVIFVGAGASTEPLQRLRLEDVIVERVVPQKALLPYMDVIIHHGGNNSFTESLFYGKPMIIMPFSSDQFDIAADAEKYHLAQVLDPNRLSDESLGGALEQVLSGDHDSALARWQKHVRSRGPGYGVGKLLHMEGQSQVKPQ